MLDEMTCQALAAIVKNANAEGAAVLTWPDGEQLVVRYDMVLLADETHDGAEEVVVDVLAAPQPGHRNKELLVVGHPGVIRSDDPPVKVEPA